MRKGFYASLAGTNLSRNYRITIPQICAGAGLTGCFYIVRALTNDQRLLKTIGGAYLPMFLGISLAVIAILSLILLFYTNSFVMKQRKKEFGMYSVLGMGRRHICRIMLFEQLYSAVLSIISGLLIGQVFYYLSAMLACRLTGAVTELSAVYVDFRSMAVTAEFFGLIWALTYLYNFIQIAKMKAVDLLKSTQTGETEPKVNLLILLIGIVTMGAGYYMAITVQSPIAALGLFFVAVILVTIGTYCFFISGSIALLKLMKKNRDFYYSPKRMTVISGMLYRMKANAAGLASVSLLATVVIIALSVTICLRAAMNDTLNNEYPYDYTLMVEDEDSAEILEPMKAKAKELAAVNNLSLSDDEMLTTLGFTVCYLDHAYSMNLDFSDDAVNRLIYMEFASDEEYFRLSGDEVHLQDDEVMVYADSADHFLPEEEMKIEEMTLHTVGILSREEAAFITSGQAYSSMIKATLHCVVNAETLRKLNELQIRMYEGYASVYISEYHMNLHGTTEDKLSFHEQIKEVFRDSIVSDEIDYSVLCKAEGEVDYVGIYGSMLFLGMIIGLVCIFATALVIYYKQISEGYEDRARFQIMKKVGMSDQEIRACIGTQTSMVFFLPLIVAGCHTAGAFPMITKLLRIFFITDINVFILCTVIVVVMFALLYFVIYSLTARTYYRIVR